MFINRMSEQLDLRHAPGAATAELHAGAATAPRSRFGDDDFGGLDQVQRFERELAAYCGTRFAIGLRDAGDAMALTLAAMGVDAGDEVIADHAAPAYVADGVRRCGAVLVLVGCEHRFGGIDPLQAALALTRRTRAVVATHRHGHPANLAPLRQMASGRKLFLIEDASQACGGIYRGQRCGAVGDAAIFDFSADAAFGRCRRAGAVVTNDSMLAAQMLVRRQLGGHAVGAARCGDLRMEEWQGAVLRAQLRRLPFVNARRRRLAGLLSQGLADCCTETPRSALHCRRVYSSYVMRARRGAALAGALRAAGLDVQETDDGFGERLIVRLDHEMTHDDALRLIRTARDALGMPPWMANAAAGCPQPAQDGDDD